MPSTAPPSLPGDWLLRSRTLPLDGPLVMGIVNVTPDSFSDGGQHDTPAAALRRATRLVAEGAIVLDVGGESTRPGARPVAPEEQMGRVLPVVRLLRRELPDVALSVDTRHATVAAAALEEGVEAVNDVSALRDPEMAGVVARAGAGLVLMHMQGTPETMQRNPTYHDVAAEVAAGLAEAAGHAREAGVDARRIVLDPGIGFGKTTDHNLELIARLDVLTRAGFPVMLGPSRKGFLGELLGGERPPEERGAATAAACVLGLVHGARLFRVHDVRLVYDALRVADAILKASPLDP